MHGGRRTAGRGSARSRADEPIPRRGAAKRRKRAEADRRRPFRRRGERLRRLRQEPSTEQRFAAARAGCARRSARSRGGSGRVGSDIMLSRFTHATDLSDGLYANVDCTTARQRGNVVLEKRSLRQESDGRRRLVSYAPAAAARRRAVPRPTIDRTSGRRGAAHALVRCGAMRASGAHASGNRRPSARRHAAGASARARARRVSAGR